jgi:hypothetical protein
MMKIMMIEKIVLINYHYSSMEIFFLNFVVI